MIDGGSAFPSLLSDHPRSEGMSLRDWFAGLAMQSCILSCEGDWLGDKGGENSLQLSEYAYRMADAMLKARESGK